jgi:hypothetical protein
MITQAVGCRDDKDKDKSPPPEVTRYPDGSILRPDSSFNDDDSSQTVYTRFFVSDVIREKIGLSIFIDIYDPAAASDAVMFTVDELKPKTFEVRAPREFRARISFTFHEDGRLKGWVTGTSESCPDVDLDKNQDVELTPDMLCEITY